MQQYVGHLIRRGVDYTQSMVANSGDKEMPQLPAWGLALVYVTAVVFVVFLSSLQYTLSDVLGTLTMIETPTNAIALPGSEEEADKKDSLLEQPQMVPVKPITSKIRTTIKHITAIGGRWARWRALVPAMVYSFLGSTASQFFAALTPPFRGRHVVCDLLTAIMLATVHMAWTHAVISMPSSLRWYQRLAPIKSVKKLWIPTAVNVVAMYAVSYLVIGFGFLIGACSKVMIAKKDGAMTKSVMAVLALQGLAIVAFAIAMSLLIVLPATVTLARVEASLLPEDQETIVPFDRTFGGKVIPEALGGTGAIGFVDAWRTFDWEARRRVVKLYVKIFVIMTAVSIAMLHVVLLEAWAIMGPQLIQLSAFFSN